MSPAPPVSPWYVDGLRFACTQCGNCCGGAPGYVWVDAEEVSHIAVELGLTEVECRLLHVRRVGRGHSLLEEAGGDCQFLERSPDGRTSCRIHAARPVQCRTWPFWKSNLASSAAWESTARHCPGLNNGRHHTLRAIQAALKDNGTRPL